jgi:hypothetical protein
MAMVKIVSPAGWDFPGPVATPVKIARDGLRGNDRREFIKRASGAESIFLPYLDDAKVAADEEPVHLIALGAKEAYGPNRNGDAFSEAVCRRYHDTFTKFARFYRNHKNKDPAHSYGVIKCSAYNPVMRRIELLVALNRTKSAADRNGGLVADREIQKLASGKDLAVSMACRVPFDECDYCGHRARTRDEYCKEATCKVGGCADNLTRLVKLGGDMYMVHVNNTHPTWFDMSDVCRPADRICYGASADWLTKAAGDHGFLGTDGARLAEQMVVPLAVVLYQDQLLPGEWQPLVAEQVKLAYGLDAMEKNAAFILPAECRRAFAADVQPALDLAAFGADTPIKTAAALGALADQKVILPLRDFARFTKRAALTDDAARLLVGVYGRMIADGSLERRVTHNAYAVHEKQASERLATKAARYRTTHALDMGAVRERCLRSDVRSLAVPDPIGGYEKCASETSPLAEELARDYAVYKLGALRRIARFDDDFPLTARLSACQNQVV